MRAGFGRTSPAQFLTSSTSETAAWHGRADVSLPRGFVTNHCGPASHEEVCYRQLADARTSEEAAQAACKAAQAAAAEAQQLSVAQREQEFHLQVSGVCSTMPQHVPCRRPQISSTAHTAIRLH